MYVFDLRFFDGFITLFGMSIGESFEAAVG